MTTLGGKRTCSSPLVLLQPYTGRLMGLLSLITAVALVEAVGLVFLAALLNLLLHAGGESNRPAWLGPIYDYAESSPRLFLLLLGLTYIGRTLLALWATYATYALALRVTDDWRTRLIRGFFWVPLRLQGQQDNRQGALLQVVVDEPAVVGLGMSAAGLLAQNALSTLTIYVVLLTISPMVTLALTGLAVVAGILVGLLSRYSRRIAARRSRLYTEGYAYITEMVGAIKQLRLFNLEAESEHRARAHLGKMRKVNCASNVIASSPRLLIEAVFLCGFALMLIPLLPQLGDASVLSAIGLTVAATLRLLPSLSASAGTWVQVQQGWPAMVRVSAELKKLDSALDNETSERRLVQVSFRERIIVRETYFAYPGRRQALAGVDLEIPRGSFTAIVGPTGSGKSTLIDLLCGFYPPDQGRISIDGIDLADISVSHWRKQLGVVSQDAFLMSGTIRDNLCLLRPDCPEGLLREIVALVGAERFIQDLPAGYGTLVGERGLALSGGQRQRLALARVLVREPRVLLMDEATSALDVESENALQVGLERLRGRLTMVVVAHRLSTVRRADCIYVLAGGKVVDSGRHEELVRRGGVYAAMCQTSEIGIKRP